MEIDQILLSLVEVHFSFIVLIEMGEGLNIH